MIAARELRGRHLEAIVDPGVDDDGHGPGERHHVRVGGPIGRGDDGLVAGIEQGHHQVVKAVFTPARHQDLVRGVFEAVLAPELLDHRTLEAGRTLDCGVLGKALGQGADGRRLDVLRGVEVRLTRRQAHDILAGGLERQGTRRDGQGRGGFDRKRALGDLKGQ